MQRNPNVFGTYLATVNEPGSRAIASDAGQATKPAVRELQVLILLDTQGPSSMEALSTLSGLSLQDVLQILASLMEQNYVVVDKPRGRNLFSVTDAGQTLLQQEG